MTKTLRRASLCITASVLPLALGCAQGSGQSLASSSEGGSGGDSSGSTLTSSSGGTQGLNQSVLGNAGCGTDCGGATVIPTEIAYCGDGLINQDDEVCDDGNAVGGDGCTAMCDQVEAGFTCPTPGLACVSNAVCGDGRVTGTETCDFGTLGANAACDATCQLQPGWVCPVAGIACVAAGCGDGIIAGTEECEFTTADPPTGCTTSCRIMTGYDCAASATDASNYTCWVTECGNATVERGEQCDDGNTLPFDGCYNCRKEPNCTDGVCVASCGDGQRFDTEACDDGNTRDGDGCSSSCEIETGFTCVDQTSDPSTQLTTPVLLRDFVGRNNALNGMAVHNDFNIGYACPVLGAVATTLNTTDRRPVFNCPDGLCTNNPADYGCYQSRGTTSDTTAFDQWYRNVDGVNIPLTKSIDLTLQTDGTYKYDSRTTTSGIFDLIQSEGWVGEGYEQLVCSSPTRNVSFTSETHFWFQYQGGEHFVFSGDDDTWVFVNNTLVIDLGGTHERQEAYFTVDNDADADGTYTGDTVWAVSTSNTVTYSQYGTYGTEKTVETNLTLGGIYEVVVFQAERNQCDSNFGITISNFSKPQSYCTSTCGDGIVASTEQCDDGTNTSTYNGCGVGCLLTPYCGDGTVQSDDEECDDGVNTSLYGGCAAGCVFGPSCGDGLVQSPYEECDDGINDGGYEECGAQCQYDTYCGDNIVQADYEECDDGADNGNGSCNRDCTLGDIY